MSFIDYYEPILDLMDLLIKERCPNYETLDTSMFRDDYSWKRTRSEKIDLWLKYSEGSLSQDATTRALIKLRDQIAFDYYFQNMSSES